MITETEVADFEDWGDAVQKAVGVLQAGGLVALPTETVYGLGADALNPEAVAKVFEVKERPHFDPLIVHLSSVKDLSTVAVVPEEIKEVVEALAKEFWPGPFTMVLPKTDAVPDLVTSGLPTVAVRVSAHEVMQDVIKELGSPIAAPSANRFGRISPTSAAAVQEELDGRIPLIIDGGASREGLESTIISVKMGEKRPEMTILRPGPVSKEALQKFGKVFKYKPASAKNSPEAPGQLPSHYAPRTPLYLFERPEDFKPEPGKRYALLSYRGMEKDGYLDLHEWETIGCLSSGTGKLAEGAVRFFYMLRYMDSLGVDAIIAEPISETGLGVAMMDRLRRASVQDS